MDAIRFSSLLLFLTLLGSGSAFATDIFTDIEGSEKLIKKLTVSSNCNANAFLVDGQLAHLTSPCVIKPAVCPTGMMPYIKRGKFAECSETSSAKTDWNSVRGKLSFKNRSMTCKLNDSLFTVSQNHKFSTKGYNRSCFYSGLLPGNELARVETIDDCQLQRCDGNATDNCNPSASNTVTMRGITTDKTVCTTRTFLSSQPAQCTPVTVTATLVCGKIMKKSVLDALRIDLTN